MTAGSKLDRDNVMMIEWDEQYGDTKITMVALFNSSRITEEEVRADIKAGSSSMNVVTMYKAQYINVFLTDEARTEAFKTHAANTSDGG